MLTFQLYYYTCVFLYQNINYTKQIYSIAKQLQTTHQFIVINSFQLNCLINVNFYVLLITIIFIRNK